MFRDTTELSLDVKIGIIKDNDDGLSQRKLAAKYNCTRTRIQTVLKRKQKILNESVAPDLTSPIAKKIKYMVQNIEKLKYLCMYLHAYKPSTCMEKIDEAFYALIRLNYV